MADGFGAGVLLAHPAFFAWGAFFISLLEIASAVKLPNDKE